MVISKKPLHFVIAALVACLPLFSHANNPVDSTAVSTEKGHAVEAKGHGHEAENANLTEDQKADLERKAHIKHHLMDPHDFTLFTYGAAEE